MSVVYRERDRERDRDRDRHHGSTVRRYIVPDDDDVRSTIVKEKDVVVRRKTSPVREVVERRIEIDSEPRRDEEIRIVTKQRVERSPPGSNEVRYERAVVRAPSPPVERERERYRDYRIEQLDRPPPIRDGYDLERYTRSVDYYGHPQPIIIRQEPVIIRDRGSRYELVERERDDYRDDRALVRREEPRRREEEDYYYERTTREVDRGRRDNGRDIEPRDSASQHPSDRYSDDDVYVRKERTIERSRSGSHHRRHLAEGAIAGIGAAEIMRHHKKKKGEETNHRGRNILGSAALGAVGAEVVSRAKSKVRSFRGSPSRSRSRSSGSDDRHRSRSRNRKKSRSRSKSRARTLGGVAAVAALGAVAGYAIQQRKKKKAQEEQIAERNPRSRRRDSSVDSRQMIEPPPEGKHLDPGHRKQRIAQAGLATAAAAGLIQRLRSRSRGAKGKERSRSKSRIRAGVPIAAAGLGGAAIAGLWEKKKARQEARQQEQYQREFSRSRSRSRSLTRSPGGRSRSRSYSPLRRHASYGDDHGARRAPGDAAMIEYGGDPIPPERPGEYRRRHRGSSSDSSPDRRRRRSPSRSRSRNRGLAEAATAAGLAGLAAHQYTKRSERKKAEKEQRRKSGSSEQASTILILPGRDREHEDELYERDHAPYSPPPMGANANNYRGDNDYYPQSNSFPPPPTGPTNEYPHEQQYPPADYSPHPGQPAGEYAPQPYNPADYPPPPGAGPGADHFPTSPGTPYEHGYPPGETFAGDPRQDHNPYHHQQDRVPQNVSPTDYVDDPHGVSLAPG